MSPEQHATFSKYKHYLNEAGANFPAIFATLSKKIDEKPFRFRYLLYILMGVEVIKAKLRSLIILDDFIHQINNLDAEHTRYGSV